MVFYRKYRPQKIAELDSSEIRQRLYNAFSDPSSVSHAFLFSGPKGLGKTSAARIVAKVVNCEKNSKLQRKTQNFKNEETKDQIEPCNKCQQCISITNGTNLDILEIDGASNRGIDEIRDLREKIRLASVSAFKKIYIIDEVHMLTTEAFNALLKTLEEPPQHVMFILCTTEPHKVPETIVSRCSHIPFKLATREELISSFKRISKEEKLDINNDALEYIVNMSDGSFRDGVKILDELASVSRSSDIAKITKEVVEKKYQISNIKYQISKLLESLEKRDTKGAINLISELVEAGVDMKFFIEKTVEELHALLLIKVGAESEVTPGMVARQRPRLLPGGTVEELKNLIELFTKAYGELKYAVLPSLPLELAVIEWGQKNEGVEIRHESSSKRGPVIGFLPASAPAKPRSSDAVRAVGNPSTNATPSAVSFPRQDSQDNIWKQFIDKVKTHNYSLAGILRGCSLKSFDGKTVEIETAYKFHKDKLSENKATEILSTAIKEISGNDIKIEVLLKEK